MKRSIFLALWIGLCVRPAASQDFEKEKLDAYFQALESNDQFMGSVAVMRDGKILYSRSLGYVDLDGRIKANDESKYRIGSISKTFTAVLILRAVEEKKLNLNQTIQKYFPTIENAGKITIKNLLNHRSGIRNFTNDEQYLTWHTQPKTEKEMVAIIAAGGSVFEPGAKAEYSNSNYVLLTYILEKTFKNSYPKILNRYIAAPLGLTNTYFGGKINTTNNECKSYRFNDGWMPEPETDLSIPLGAGGIVSTSTDLVTFSHALFSGKLLKKESLELMKSVIDRFGLGLIQFPFYDKSGYGHTGGIDGFSSLLVNFENDVSYALLSNGTRMNTNDISIAVLSAVYGKPYHVPDFKSQSHNPSDEELESYGGVYSSPQFPLKITITKSGKSLMAQATGQPSFVLTATAKNRFEFPQAGLVLEFDVAANTMLLKQAGAEHLLKRE
jgi:CubicO group peptidase (beta-lactamase class C family)